MILTHMFWFHFMKNYDCFSFQEYLPESEWNKLKKYFIENSYSCHPETVLYCAFVSSMSDDESKQRALELMLEAREHAKMFLKFWILKICLKDT